MALESHSLFYLCVLFCKFFINIIDHELGILCTCCKTYFCSLQKESLETPEVMSNIYFGKWAKLRVWANQCLLLLL